MWLQIAEWMWVCAVGSPCGTRNDGWNKSKCDKCPLWWCSGSFPLGQGLSEAPSVLPSSPAAREEVCMKGWGQLCFSGSAVLGALPEPAGGYGVMISSDPGCCSAMRCGWQRHQAGNPGSVLCLAEQLLVLLAASWWSCCRALCFSAFCSLCHAKRSDPFGEVMLWVCAAGFSCSSCRKRYGVVT